MALTSKAPSRSIRAPRRNPAAARSPSRQLPTPAQQRPFNVSQLRVPPKRRRHIACAVFVLPEGVQHAAPGPGVTDPLSLCKLAKTFPELSRPNLFTPE